MYEHRTSRLLPRRRFIRRMVGHILAACGLIAGALFAGMAGYHWLADQPWIDAFLNAAMILGGMGPVDPLNSQPAKLFAGCYALFSGVFFLVCVGVVIAPLLHRLLHYLHLESADQAEDNDPDEPNDGRRDRPHRPKKQKS